MRRDPVAPILTWMSASDDSARVVDPQLTQRVRDGRYAVPSERVAEAMLRRRESPVEPASVPQALAEVERGLAMLVAGKRHLLAVPAPEHHAASGGDPA